MARSVASQAWLGARYEKTVRRELTAHLGSERVTNVEFVVKGKASLIPEAAHEQAA